MALTPVGDIAGIATEGTHYLTGEPVDHINLGLSVIGLGATALTLATVGASTPVKLGAAAAKLAHRMGLLTPRLIRLAGDALKDGIDWAHLSSVRSAEDAARIIRPTTLAPLIEVARDTGRIEAALGPSETLHLIRYIDDVPDARRLAAASEALGEKTVGRIEVLGKARFLRLTLRFSHHALALLAGVFGLIASLGTMAAHAAHHALWRQMHHRARRLRARDQIRRT